MTYNPAIPFDLEFLPPKGSFTPSDYAEILIKAHTELAELKGYSARLPDQQLLLPQAILKESIESSSIENINTTMVDVLENQLLPESEQTLANKEVLRYKEAVTEGFAKLKNEKVINTRLILKVKELLMPTAENTFRTVQNGIKNEYTKKIVYTPPVASKINSLLGNLENYINDPKNKIDPLIKAAILHYQFEAIHPFTDGNGRTGRILMVLYLVQKRLLTYPTIYISEYINTNRNEYYKRLLAVTTNGDWRNYINFMLMGFYQQAKNTRHLLFEILEHQYELEDKFKKDKKIYKAGLIEALFEYPIINPAVLAKEMNIDRETATRYLNYLTKIKILRDRRVGKYHLYINHKLLSIISKR